ncbi:MAG: hypothetical protein Q9171_004610 [Xanthocarpia ochracea]
MLFSTLTLALLPTLTLSFPLDPPQSRLHDSHLSKDRKTEPLLPTCSPLSFHRPCQCPEGTSYASTVTYGVIGANAKDIHALCGNYFEIEWLGMRPMETAGPPDTVGSTRTNWVPTMMGNYKFIEELLRWDESPDGGFASAFNQQNIPIVYNDDVGPGAFAGQLITWKSQYLGQYQTSVTWSVYTCYTGGLLGFPEFHESALKNVTEVLKGQGKLKGTSIKPWSTDYSIPVDRRFEL